MTKRMEGTTAILALAFGSSLLMANTVAQSTGAFDARMARELAVLARVLEKRLADMRMSIAPVVSPQSANPCSYPSVQ